ncbi:unnamed protein product [Rotaria socialis]|uniref:Esterase n=1 Tax=Rotaria socialis TaxID=392032 RepID=A0A820AL11_9BILA|nr:unnamed protein product [Rotaria socialis]CAF3502314.1 unnamed protein product [Rotaria socialis]CAF4194918.1 unnamed protein product [Rotaria socialis]CAF4676715.1 unnamed protein product [Rotaria socialis]
MKNNSFLVTLLIVLCSLVSYIIGDAPHFISAFGLTVRSSSQLTNQLYEVVVSTEEVLGDQKIRILVPTDYATSGVSRRYPVLYLLHGAGGSEIDWTTSGIAGKVCSNLSLITVMPNGGEVGFYTNWIIPGKLAPQNWRTFHMEQLVPWVDFNLRTLTKKQGRAIAGYSMGGFGAIHYAELYSSNFVYAASFSGALDLMNPVIQSLIYNIRIIDNKPLVGPFGYPSDSISSNEWFAQSTTTHAAVLHDISVALYTGNVGSLEVALRDSSYRLRDLLTLFSFPVYFMDYGDGKLIGYGCDGNHDWLCFNAALIDVLPRIMAVLQQEF